MLRSEMKVENESHTAECSVSCLVTHLFISVCKREGVFLRYLTVTQPKSGVHLDSPGKPVGERARPRARARRGRGGPGWSA